MSIKSARESSPEYLRVSKEIDGILSGYYKGLSSRDMTYIKNSILSIKGVAIIADDQSLPDIECFKGQVKRILIQTNFKRMVE